MKENKIKKDLDTIVEDVLQCQKVTPTKTEIRRFTKNEKNYKQPT